MSDLDTTADRSWTIEAVQELVKLAREAVPATLITLKLKRSIGAVNAKLLELASSSSLRVPEGTSKCHQYRR